MKLRALLTHPWMDRGFLICTMALLVWTAVELAQQAEPDVSSRRVFWVAVALACVALSAVVRRPAVKWTTLTTGVVCLVVALFQR